MSIKIIFGVVFSILLIASVASLVYVVVLFYNKYENKPSQKYNETDDEFKERLRIYNKSDSKYTFGIIGTLLASVLFLGLVITIPGGFYQVDTGEVAVVKVWGNARETKTEGLYFKNIISTKTEIYDLKTQELRINSPAYTKDTQPMDIELFIQYRIQSDKVIEIARKFGNLSILESRIINLSEEAAKVVLATYTAETLIAGREALSSTIKTRVILSTEDYYVDIVSVALTNIDFSDAFEEIIEQKMIAEQEVLKAQNEKEKAIIKAQEELEVAILKAQQDLEKAKGEADAQKEIAKAQAEAIRLKSIEIARMLGFEIIETEEITIINMEGKTSEEIELISNYLKYIEYLSVWDGQLPQVITDSGGNIIIPMP